MTPAKITGKIFTGANGMKRVPKIANGTAIFSGGL